VSSCPDRIAAASEIDRLIVRSPTRTDVCRSASCFTEMSQCSAMDQHEDSFDLHMFDGGDDPRGSKIVGCRIRTPSPTYRAYGQALDLVPTLFELDDVVCSKSNDINRRLEENVLGLGIPEKTDLACCKIQSVEMNTERASAEKSLTYAKITINDESHAMGEDTGEKAKLAEKIDSRKSLKRRAIAGHAKKVHFDAHQPPQFAGRRIISRVCRPFHFVVALLAIMVAIVLTHLVRSGPSSKPHSKSQSKNDSDFEFAAPMFRRSGTERVEQRCKMTPESFQWIVQDVAQLIRRYEHMRDRLQDPKHFPAEVAEKGERLLARISNLISKMKSAGAHGLSVLFVAENSCLSLLHVEMEGFLSQTEDRALDKMQSRSVTPETFQRVQDIMLEIVESVNRFQALRQQLQQEQLQKIMSRKKQLTEGLLILQDRGGELEENGRRMMTESEAREYADELEKFRLEYDAFVQSVDIEIRRSSFEWLEKYDATLS